MIANEVEHPVASLLKDFAYGTLGEQEITRVAAHLDLCAHCRARVDEFLSTESFMEKLRSAKTLDGAVVEDDAERRRAARALLREFRNSPTSPSLTLSPEESAPRVVGEYGIVRELGRGGMGVVYQATHRSLRRVVALKMILSGGFASESQRQRFRREAELAARVQHPNIVQIFEVGLAGERPYLALEFVEGGTLADRQLRSPLKSHASARLVEILARAVHHAHARGIIHRDLKPANILLQESAETPSGAEGVAPGGPDGPYLIPKITDFGLARSSDGICGLTESGMVMGTPSYISPEQARGDRDLGPSTDIYSLGAILYDLLAGRPPFLADTPFQTVRQVIDQEPPRPSKWLANLPHDLETICLKCLDKNPVKRYATAEALANDLRSWRQGERISARPSHSLERAAKWCRRRPALAASLFAVGALALAITVISTLAAIQLREERNAVVAESERALRSEQQHRIALVDSLMIAAPASVPYMLETIGRFPDLALPLIREQFEHSATGSEERLRSAVALTVLGEPKTAFLMDRVPEIPPAESGNIALAMRKTREPGITDELVRRAREAGDPRRRARYAILALDRGDIRGARPLVAFSPDPNFRSVLIDEFQSWHGDLAALPGVLRDCEDADCRAALCGAVGRVDSDTLSEDTHDALVDTLSHLYLHAPDAGTHSASAWALRQWGAPLPAVAERRSPESGIKWFINRAGMSMVVLEPGGFLATTKTVSLVTRPVLISDREVSLGLFRKFIDDPNFPAAEKPLPWRGPDLPTCTAPDCPVNNVSRPEAVLFCNWLSDREGRKRCYTRSNGPGGWTCDFEADGYRLPTDAEWDYGQRAGSTSTFFFGDDPRWMATYAHTSSLRTAPGASKVPNRWGLFDMVGNVWELCWDAFAPVPATLLVDSTGPANDAGMPWVGRGGAFDSGSFDTRAEYRVSSGPPGGSLGFRVVCRDPAVITNKTAARDAALDVVFKHIPDNSLLYQWHAECDGQSARWAAAAAVLRRQVALNPVDIISICRCLALLVQLDDKSGYRQLCHTMLQQFGANPDPKIADRVARFCLVFPNSMDDLGPVARLAERALAGEAKSPSIALGQLACAMADYRTGRFADGERRLNKFLALEGTIQNRQSFALGSLFLAMTQQRLGQPDLARRTFANVEKLVGPDLDALAKGNVVGDWEDLLVLSLVDREARALIAPGTKADPPAASKQP